MNPAADTRMGGDNPEFPSTQWSLVAGVVSSTPGQRQQALEKLCQRYWKPVHHFIRRAWSKSPEDAKDLTQAFFLKLLEGEALRKYAPDRGGFRTYLKVLLRGFAADQHDALHALKRGGGVKVLALDGLGVPLQELIPDEQAESPDRVFDWSWRKQVLERAVERVRTSCEQEDRVLQFRCFEEYDLKGEEPKPTYATVASRLGLSEGDVRNHLFTVRERLRGEIRAELSQTVCDPAQLEEEWRNLFGA